MDYWRETALFSSKGVGPESLVLSVNCRRMEGWSVFTGILASISCGLIYSYCVVFKLPKGFQRLITVIPVIGMYAFLPWQVSTVHIRGIISFLFMWISSFKLIMLCFDVGPLAEPWAHHNLSHFMAVAAFPIKVRHLNSAKDSLAKEGKFTALISFIIKGCLLAGVIYTYSFRNSLPHYFILFLYGVHMYLALEIVLVSMAALAYICLGAELEPQFNKPYLATSLQDFWGKRWNLIVTNTLRPSVYEPVLNVCWEAHNKLNKKNIENQPAKVGAEKPPLWARAVAMLSAFVVSALMHELIFYYITETKPTWEVTAFFTLHGLIAAIEVGLKRRLAPFLQLPRFIAIIFTLVFVCITGFWLFLPPITRSGTDVKTIAEYEIFLHYLFPATRGY
eukprot:Gb_09227 [translate_table: standard]